MNEWNEAQGKPQRLDQDNTTRVWNPPPPNLIKVNLDVGWTGTSANGFGLAARDHNSSMMVAATHSDPFRYDPIVAEALAMRWCLSLMADLGM